MKKSLLLIIGITLIAISSCEYKFIEPVAIQIPDGPVSFADDVEPIFQNKCVSCHASRNPILSTGSAFNSLTSGGYVNVSDPESSSLIKKVMGGHPGGSGSLNSQEIGIILKWIQDGAENN